MAHTHISIIENEKSSNKWFSKTDRKAKDDANKALWNEKVVKFLAELKDVADEAYDGRKFVNYNKKFVVLKLETPRTKDWNWLGVFQDMLDAVEHKIVFNTRGDIIFRIFP